MKLEKTFEQTRKKMKTICSVGPFLIVGIFFVFIEKTQQIASQINKNGNRYPSYSLQNMPKTDFSCRGKILGGYYADADTQCQMFHICVKVAGVGVQDFRFLCPNGTAFDQEAQTCADFGDVDCEQATLFYGSDNFDLYRIGSGFDSSKRPTPTTEDESTFHLQRAESNDIRRSKQPASVQSSLYGLGSPFNQQQFDRSTVKPANQYQSQKVTTTPTTTTARNNFVHKKSTTTAVPFIASKSTTSVPTFLNSNYNDEIFKGSHSSNFYSNRNSNDDDDDYKRSSVTNNKSQQRPRGRAHYRGTPATTTTSTTLKPPVVQNYTTLTSFTTKSTTPSPFKFTFASASPNVASQINFAPLGPLQQQYQQPNYNNNFVNFKIQTTTSDPTSTTQKNILRPNNFNNIISTPADFNAPQRPIVSVPTPFNTNYINVDNKHDTNGKIVNNAFINQKASYNTNTSSYSRQSSGRVFDNHNPVNNYQTTSPFANHKTFENHIPANNTVLRLAPTQNNQLNQQNKFIAQSTTNNTFYQSNQYYSTTVHPPTTTTHAQIIRNPSTPERPNFSQQDLINQFNFGQQKLTQQKQTNNNANINRHPDAQNALTSEQKRLQLHYDINDYLTTDKYTQNQYSPTSEQYKSVQLISSATVPQISQSTPIFTRKYNDAVFSTTPKINRQQYETNNQYKTQHDRPSNLHYNSNSKINDKIAHTTSQSIIPSTNENNYVPSSTKKFSTLVPKENYAPTTFKPLFYFNVAKQINDNLSTISKVKTATETLTYSSTSTTSRSVPIEPIFNRGSIVSRPNFSESTATKPQLAQQPFKQIDTSVIDENDGQYHPELYEKDFARYKIKNRKKQQQISQISQKQHFAKPQTDFGIGNKHQSNINRGTQKSFGTSVEEEILNTAHSQNIAAASGNELYISAKSKQSQKISTNAPSNAPANAPTNRPNTSKKENLSISKDEKDVSYDYAYYDSGNDAPHEYSEFDLPDFGKTRN